MVYPDIFKKLKVTYADMNKAMSSLGFSSRVLKSDDEKYGDLFDKPRYFIHYYDKSGRLLYAVYQQPDDELVRARDLFSIALELCSLEITKAYEDFAEIINKNRRKEKTLLKAAA